MAAKFRLAPRLDSHHRLRDEVFVQEHDADVVAASGQRLD